METLQNFTFDCNSEGQAMTNASIKSCFLILNSAIFIQNRRDIYSEAGVQNQTPNSNTAPSPEICCLSLSEKGQSAGSIFYTDISCMALNYNLPYPEKPQRLKNTERESASTPH